MEISHRRIWRCIASVCVLAAWAAAPAPARAAKDVDPNYLALTDCPGLPGCPALILVDETELNNDSNRSKYTRHRLVKVFTQQGIDEFSDVETPAAVGGWDVRNLSGRTILPGGAVIPLKQENVFVKYLRQGKRHLRVKTAKFPGVVPGAMVEWSYDVLTDPYRFLTEVTWPIQQHLPVLEAKFTMRPGDYQMGWRQAGAEKVEVHQASPFKNVTYFTAANVPPIPDEPFGPPDESLQARYHFDLPELQSSWLGCYMGRLARKTGKFIEEAPGIAEKVKELAAPDDPPIEKVKKFYRFVQEKIGTEEERAGKTEQSATKDAENAGEVLARGYGNEFERTLLFLALVKEADLEHGFLVIASRLGSGFNDQFPDEDQFDSFAAAVKAGANWTFYDPAAKHCPFGMISAEKEGGAFNAAQIIPEKSAGAPKEALIQHLRVQSNEMVAFRVASIPFSAAAKNVLKRDAHVTIGADGSAEARITEQGSGLVDLDRRDRYESADEEKRKSLLLEAVHESLPRTELASASFSDIASFDKAATLDYTLRLPEFASLVGDRLVAAMSFLDAARPNPFTAETRRTPVHFPHTQRTQDRIVLEVPAGYAIGDLPAPTVVRDPPFSLTMSFAREADTVVLTRRLEIDAAVWPAADYARLKSFFQKVQEADRQVIVLKKGAAS